MSHTTRYFFRRPLVVAGLVLLGLAATAAISQAPHHCAATTGKRSPSDLAGDRYRSAYFAEFTGIGAEGRDMVWRGAVAGAAIGELTVRLAHVGRDVDTASPTWPVEGTILVSSEDPQRALAADVHGTIDWPTKRVTLAGEVSVGYMRGARVEQTADLLDGDLSGELRLAPATFAARLPVDALH